MPRRKIIRVSRIIFIGRITESLDSIVRILGEDRISKTIYSWHYNYLPLARNSSNRCSRIQNLGPKYIVCLTQ